MYIQEIEKLRLDPPFFFQREGDIIVWKTTTLFYFTVNEFYYN